MYFRCDSCNAVYWAYYPVDDCCIKCNAGLIRFIEDITQEPDHQESGFSISKEDDQ